MKEKYINDALDICDGFKFNNIPINIDCNDKTISSDNPILLVHYKVLFKILRSLHNGFIYVLHFENALVNRFINKHNLSNIITRMDLTRYQVCRSVDFYIPCDTQISNGFIKRKIFDFASIAFFHLDELNRSEICNNENIFNNDNSLISLLNSIIGDSKQKTLGQETISSLIRLPYRFKGNLQYI